MYVYTYIRAYRVFDLLSVYCPSRKFKEILMIEKQIERKLIEAVVSKGGIAPKFVSPGLAGVPDRIVLMPEGKVVFAEVKAPGKKMRPLQLRRKDQLEALGFKVCCIDSMESIEHLCQALGGEESEI